MEGLVIALFVLLLLAPSRYLLLYVGRMKLGFGCLGTAKPKRMVYGLIGVNRRDLPFAPSGRLKQST